MPSALPRRVRSPVPLLVLAGAGLLGGGEATPEVVPPPPVIERVGARTVLDVEVAAAHGDEGGRMRIYLHGERAYTAYYVARGEQQPMPVRMALARAGDALAGAFTLVIGGKGRGNVVGRIVLRLGPSPAATVELGGGTREAIVTRVDPAALAAANALRAGADYPQAGGPDCMGPSPIEAPLVEDIAQARLVWKSEDTQLISSPPRMPKFGLGSPVVAKGTVVFSYYQPTGEPPWFASGNRTLNIEKAMAEAEFRPYLSRHAHDVVVAIDAATGLTRWRAVLTRRGMNFQGDQKNNASGGPMACIVGERVVVAGYGGRLYGLDLATGELAWERVIAESTVDVAALWRQQVAAAQAGTPPLKTIDGTLNGAEPVACDGVVALDVKGVLAIDPATGATLWHDPEGHAAWFRNHVRIWRDAAGDRFVYPRRKGRGYEFALVEPRTGKRTLAAEIGVQLPSMGWCVAGRRLVVFSNNVTKHDQPMAVHAFDADLAGGRWTPAWNLTLDQVRFHACAAVPADGHLFLGGVREQVVARIDPAAGRLVGYLPAIGGQNSYYELSAGWNRVILKEHALECLVADPGQAKPKTLLPFPVTAGYDDFMPRMAWADGRLFIAVHDGVACVDLRAPR